MIETYDWAGGREAILRFGAGDAPRIVAAPALFGEGNRTRAFLVAILRGLAGAGIASALPDLPGTNDSPVATADATLADWRAAFAHVVAERPSLILTVRGGALVDGDATAIGRYRIAPVDGSRIVRDLVRARRVVDADFDSGAIHQPGMPIELAGNMISRGLLADLDAACVGGDARIARLATDPLPADRKVEGRPLWYGIEPDTDATLVATLVDDISGWVCTCAG